MAVKGWECTVLRLRKARASTQIRPDPDEQDTRSVLRDSEPRCIEHLGVYAIFPVERQVLKDLSMNDTPCQIFETWDVLHHKRTRPKSGDNFDVVAIQSISRIIDHSMMVAHLRECLARRATDYSVKVNAVGCSQQFLFSRTLGNVTQDELRPVSGVIKAVRRTCPPVIVGCCDYPKASEAKSFREAACTSE
jgi:hypothetical protein